MYLCTLLEITGSQSLWRRDFRVFSAYLAENTLKSLSSALMIACYFQPCLYIPVENVQNQQNNIGDVFIIISFKSHKGESYSSENVWQLATR